MNMPPMLAYTVQSTPWQNNAPSVTVGIGRDSTGMRPANPQDDSYWFCIINAKNPREKVKDWVLPGNSNSTVPAGIDTYMNNPDYLFVVATQFLSTLHVPQGALYDFLAKYGAGRELQKLEQVNAVLGCGGYGRVGYVLTGQCGPRKPGEPAPPSYEVGSFFGHQAMLLMSLMPQANGAPPYSICDSYTWKSPPAMATATKAKAKA
ncbi:MAG TPA: hypothetical protein VF601_04035 [Beijerinckiaceae bacterium]